MKPAVFTVCLFALALGGYLGDSVGFFALCTLLIGGVLIGVAWLWCNNGGAW